MPAKKKSVRSRKLLQMVEVKNNSINSGDKKQYERAIRRQMGLIKKDYDRLITDVAGGIGLLKNWVEVEATTRREMLKSRFAKNTYKNA
jgi:hypothetical protein